MKRILLLIILLFSLPALFGQKIEVLKINIADNVNDTITYQGIDTPVFSDVIIHVLISKNNPRFKIHLKLINDSDKDFDFNGESWDREQFSVIFSYKGENHQMDCDIYSPVSFVTISPDDSLEVVLLCGSPFFSNKNYAQEFLNIMSTFRVTYDIKKDSGVKRIKTPKLKIQSVTFDNVSK